MKFHRDMPFSEANDSLGVKYVLCLIFVFVSIKRSVILPGSIHKAGVNVSGWMTWRASMWVTYLAFHLCSRKRGIFHQSWPGARLRALFLFAFTCQSCHQGCLNETDNQNFTGWPLQSSAGICWGRNGEGVKALPLFICPFSYQFSPNLSLSFILSLPPLSISKCRW